MPVLRLAAAGALFFTTNVGSAHAQPTRVEIGYGLVSLEIPDAWERTENKTWELRLEPKPVADVVDFTGLMFCTAGVLPVAWAPGASQELTNANAAAMTAANFPANHHLEFKTTTVIDGVRMIDRVMLLTGAESAGTPGAIKATFRGGTFVGPNSATSIVVGCTFSDMGPFTPRPQDDEEDREFLRRSEAAVKEEMQRIQAFLDSIRINRH